MKIKMYWLQNLTIIIKHKFTIYSAKVNWFVFVLVTLFATGSWVDMNGMWCELPIMVHELPEGWRLPSILGLIMQLSQIGSLFLLVYKYFFPRRFSLLITIYIIFVVGIISCFLLIFFWNKTAKIGNEERSVGLYILTFMFGILDGTSTITFLPYIGEYFSKEYVIPNYVGESLSSMIPSVLIFIQGIGDTDFDTNCTNFNQSLSLGKDVTPLPPLKPLNPRYSVSTYFFLLFLVLVISTIAFTLLHYAPNSIRSRIVQSDTAPIVESTKPNSTTTTAEVDKLSYTSLTSLIEQKPSDIEIMNSSSVKSDGSKATSKEVVLLLVMITMVSFVSFGISPGIGTYTVLPYGKDVFHLSVALGSFFVPFSIMISITAYDISVKQIFIEFMIANLISIYGIILAVQSPCPFLVNYRIGAIIVVLSGVINASLYTRIRCCIAAKLQQSSPSLLFINGVLTTVGQIFGGILIYVLVEKYRLFKELGPCEKVADICK